jgi:hypothetical protein
MKKSIKWFIGSLILLLPTLFFPLNRDQSQFIQAARALNAGGKIFVDFIDLKPPAMYYIYWFFREIVGENVFGFHLLDISIVMITLFLLFRLIKKYSESSAVAGLTILIYSALYTSLGYHGVFQPAMFAGLATVSVLSLHLYAKEITGSKKILVQIVTALIIGLVTGIKYTYGILLFATITDYFLLSGIGAKTKIKFALLTCSVALAGFALTFLPLLDQEVYRGFLNISSVLSSYAGRPEWSPELLKQLLVLFAEVFADKYSALISIAAGISIAMYLLNSKHDSEKSKNFTGTLILFGAFLLFSAVFEKKLYTYHFVRLFPIFTFLAATTIVSFFRYILKHKNEFSRLDKILILMLIGSGVMFSPIVRFAYRVQAPMYYLTGKSDKYNLLFSDRVDGNYNHGEAIQVAEYINSRYGYFDGACDKQPFFMAVQSSSSIVNFLTPKYRHSTFGQSQFYFSVEAPQEWQEKAFDEIKQADIILFATNDASEDLFGHSRVFGKNYSSFGYIFDLETEYSRKVKSFVESNFRQTHKTENYLIYEKSM